MRGKDTWLLQSGLLQSGSLWSGQSDDSTPARLCALCERPLGSKVEMHHLVPKSKGGKETVPLHPICHRKIHATFRETTLARNFATIDCLRNDSEIATFIAWLRGKPPDFYRRTGRTQKR